MDIHFYIELTNTVGKRNWTEEEEDGKKKYLVMHVCNEKKGKRKKGKTNVRKKKKRTVAELHETKLHRGGAGQHFTLDQVRHHPACP